MSLFSGGITHDRTHPTPNRARTRIHNRQRSRTRDELESDDGEDELGVVLDAEHGLSRQCFLRKKRDAQSRGRQ